MNNKTRELTLTIGRIKHDQKTGMRLLWAGLLELIPQR